MLSNEVRNKFLKYFAMRGHTVVASSPLVPGNDPTLLFTNAGMVQFKDVFLGVEKRSYSKATSAQLCVRAGGKHNDLENVGYTARHHTLFEMLGNFSFGDYFKHDAVQYAWDFLTNKEQGLGIAPEKLLVTYYEEDEETAKIWRDVWSKDKNLTPAVRAGLEERLTASGAKDNFWSMGDTGPCGPCTEIFYDHGPEIPGGPPGSPDEDGDRYIEIWNLVFMQYERAFSGELTPLPRPSVDTGMGLERVAAVLQGVHNNYDTDLFQPIIHILAQEAKVDPKNPSLRVIADHIRSSAFLIAEGVIPSNEGRGYVLRRIVRRAIRHASKFSFMTPFLNRLVGTLVGVMGQAYPDLAKAQSHIERVLRQEEDQFARTLETGLKLLEEDIAKLSDRIIPGETVFRLYDTYGFPVDLTADIARERGLTIDTAGFEVAMGKQREKSQAASKFGVDYTERLTLSGETNFTGYEHSSHEATVIALYCDNEPADSLQTRVESIVVLDKTPFYAEGGGQVGDSGWIYGPNGQFQVRDTQRKGQSYLHLGQLTQGTLQVGDKVRAEIDSEKRRATALNHSATHLLHSALRNILGEHVMQKGSLVEPERLRFDFTHFAPLTFEQMKSVTSLVNQQIRMNYPVETQVMTPEEAKNTGALAFFGEKYGEQVRVLAMGAFSKELCGGTHVKRTGDIGLFKITVETGIAAGIRRIEAVTGEYALNAVDQLEDQLRDAAQLFKTGRENLIEKIKKHIQQTQNLEKQLVQLQNRLANAAGNDLMQQAIEIEGVTILIAEIDGLDLKGLRDTLDQLKSKLTNAVIVLGSVFEVERVQLVAGVTKDLLDKVKANELISAIASEIGGKGGGRPDFAQAGGNKPKALQLTLQAAKEFIQQTLKK